jgi:hypothetical protein
MHTYIYTYTCIQAQQILAKYNAQAAQLSFSVDYYCRQGDVDFAALLQQEVRHTHTHYTLYIYIYTCVHV